ncbi:hypothetical protein RQM69_06480 [Citrobacter freundii]|nr:hypothetical protein [Citrobacter freundii]MDT7359615.1 hypothetical protein [Citrobacter freundii]
MSRLRALATALVAVAAMTMCATPVLANPGCRAPIKTRHIDN